MSCWENIFKGTVIWHFLYDLCFGICQNQVHGIGSSLALQAQMSCKSVIQVFLRTCLKAYSDTTDCFAICLFVCLFTRAVPKGKSVSGYISTRNNRPGHYNSGHSQQTKFYVHCAHNTIGWKSGCLRNPSLILPLNPFKPILTLSTLHPNPSFRCGQKSAKLLESNHYEYVYWLFRIWW